MTGKSTMSKDESNAVITTHADRLTREALRFREEMKTEEELEMDRAFRLFSIKIEEPKTFIEVLTQSQYDSITPSPDTLYFIASP